MLVRNTATGNGSKGQLAQGKIFCQITVYDSMVSVQLLLSKDWEDAIKNLIRNAQYQWNKKDTKSDKSLS